VGTTQKLIERYNTFTRRPNLSNRAFQEQIFGSFDRTVGQWLPHDNDAPLLDVACGEGSLLMYLRHRGFTDLQGFDLSPENVAICHQLGLSFVQEGDALRLDDIVERNSKSVVFALDILEHISKEKAAEFVASLWGTVEPGGTLIMQTPNMACVFGQFHRYNDLTHEFCLTEKTARDLCAVASIPDTSVEVLAAWNATTSLGRVREVYLRLLHKLVYLSEDSSRPQVPTKNLLIVARK